MQAPNSLFFSLVSPRYAQFMPCGKAHLVNPYQLVSFWFGEMAPLKFICPATGNEVDTGIDVDPQSFAGLPRDTTAFPPRIAMSPTCLQECRHDWVTWGRKRVNARLWGPSACHYC